MSKSAIDVLLESPKMFSNVDPRNIVEEAVVATTDEDGEEEEVIEEDVFASLSELLSARIVEEETSIRTLKSRIVEEACDEDEEDEDYEDEEDDEDYEDDEDEDEEIEVEEECDDEELDEEGKKPKLSVGARKQLALKRKKAKRDPKVQRKMRLLKKAKAKAEAMNADLPTPMWAAHWNSEKQTAVVKKIDKVASRKAQIAAKTRKKAYNA